MRKKKINIPHYNLKQGARRFLEAVFMRSYNFHCIGPGPIDNRKSFTVVCSELVLRHDINAPQRAPLFVIVFFELKLVCQFSWENYSLAKMDVTCPWTLLINRTTLFVSLEDTFQEIANCSN